MKIIGENNHRFSQFDAERIFEVMKLNGAQTRHE